MKKKALFKDFYMEIKNSLGRFLSIFFIVALGVAFYAGLRATEPDMRLTGDAYFDWSQMMHIQVQSTLGLEKEDVDAILDIESVEKAEPGYTVDALMEVDGMNFVVRMISMPETMNVLDVKGGRLPEKKGECFVEEKLMRWRQFEIGDELTLEPGTKDPLTDSLETTRFTIVGYGNSPQFFTFNRGNSMIGTGEVAAFAYTVQESYSLDVYTEIAIAVKGASEKTAFMDEYDDVVTKTMDEIKSISGDREQARYDNILVEANEKIADASQELEDGRETANRELSEAEQKLLDAEEELADAKQTIEDNRILIRDGITAIEDGKRELRSKQGEINNGWESYRTGISQWEAGQTEFEASKATFEQMKEEKLPELEQGEQEFREKEAIAQPQLDALWQQYELIKDIPGQEAMAAMLLEQWNQGVAELEAGRALLAAGRQQLEDGERQIQEGQQQLTDSKATLDMARTQLISGQAALDEGWGTISEKEKELIEGQQKLIDGEQELADGEQELLEGWIEFEEERDKALQEIADGEAELEDAKEKLADIEMPEWFVNDRSVILDYDDLGNNAAQIGAIGNVFPMLFFLVAALISLTTMTRMVEEQRLQIGTLKALGYSNITILFKYVNYAFLATVGGSILGFLIGQKLIPWVVIRAYMMMYPNFPHIHVPYQWDSIIFATAAAVFTTLFATIFACYKETLHRPAVLMRPPSPKKGKRVFLERIGFIWKRLSFIWKSTVRNLFRYKKRFLMTVFGIGGCMALLVVGFGVEDAIFEIGSLQFEGIEVQDMTVFFRDDITPSNRSEMESYLASNKDVSHSMYLFYDEVTIGSLDDEREITLQVPENAKELEDFLKVKSRVGQESFSLKDGGVIISEQRAEKLGVQAGDTLIIKDDDIGEIEVRVDFVMENYIGHKLLMTANTYRELFHKEPAYNSIQLRATLESSDRLSDIGYVLLENEDVLNVIYTKTMIGTLDNMIDSMGMIVAVLIISAGMLAFVVLYNLNNINITERKRELATIKVLGFYDGEVAAYIYRENIILMVVGIAVGIFLGGLLHRYILATIEIDAFMFNRIIHWSSYAKSILLTVIFSAFVNWVMFFKLRKINMVESLKSVE